MTNTPARSAATPFWKHNTSDLQALAGDILTSVPFRYGIMTPRECARALFSVVRFIDRHYSNAVMRECCARLARDPDGWAAPFSEIQESNRFADDRQDPIFLLMVTCVGLMGVAQPAAVRSALAFWAVEMDPNTWFTQLQ